MPKSEHHESASARVAPRPFPGFSRPNYTPVPDELFDELLVELSGAELKALLYIVRRTFGFKRESDTISLSQMLGGIRTRDGRILDRGVGLSKKTLLLALRTLEDRGIILTERRQSAEKGNEPTVYQLHVIGQNGTAASLGEESTPPLGEKLPQGVGGEITPSPWGKNYTTQNTVKQETVRQERVEQDPGRSNSFDRFASTRQERGPSGLSKAARSDAESRQAARAGSAGMTAVGQIVSRRRGATSGTALDDAPRSPKTAPETADTRESRASDRPTPYTPQNGAHSGAHRADLGGAGRGVRRPPPPKLPPYLEDIVGRYSQELHDDEHIAQNLGQAGRLWKASGWSEASFGQALVEAKEITLRRDIKKRATIGGELGARNKMP